MDNIYFPLEVWQMILNHSDFLTQIRLRQVCRSLYFLKILDLCDIPNDYKFKLEEKIIESYPYIKHLDISKKDISQTCLNKLINLESLVITYDFSSNLNQLIKLTKLRIIHKLWRFAPFGNDYISNCTNITQLILTCNLYLSDINHLHNLKVLKMDHNFVLHDNGISNCINLVYLEVNGPITNINHCTKLITLIIKQDKDEGKWCRITNDGFKQCVNIMYLDISGNSNITNISHCKKLKTLIANKSLLTNDSLMQCTNITHLELKENTQISDINHLINLRTLYLGSYSNLYNRGITNCVNITELRLDYNQSITDIYHLTKLTKLWINYRSRISLQTARLLNIPKIFCNDMLVTDDNYHLFLEDPRYRVPPF